MALNCAISVATYRQRRQRLQQALGHTAAALIPAAPEQVRSRDSLYPYRPDSNMWYLSGFAEPEAVLVIAPGHPRGDSFLFCRARDLAREAWDGPRLGPERAAEVCGVDAAWPLSELPARLPELLGGRETLYSSRMDHPLLLDLLAAPGFRQLSADPLLHDMRLFKDDEELRLMRHAAAISVEAHARAMHAVHPGQYEYQLQAELEYVFTRHGAVPAYESIVGAGAHGCILHYRANRAQIQDGELVLIDAGCEYLGYAADITRTFPGNGRFTPEQRVLHDLVLSAHAAALAKAHPGNPWDSIHQAAVETLSEGLLRLGLIDDAADYKRFYPHKSGHWLGLDVHDVGAYEHEGQSRPLQPGMVLTIEPGLYIPPGAQGIAPKWWGIGIRIEDDVLITAAGQDLLTAGLARSSDEIEDEMAKMRH